MKDNIKTSTLTGLNLDRTLQESNDVTFALNCVRDSFDGGRQEYQSEPGNILSQNISGHIVGTIYGEDDEVYVFSVLNGISEIGLFKQGKYTEIVESDCLDFNPQYPITGEYRVKNGCEKIIYWCDKFNPDRFFNLSKNEDFLTNGNWDCNKFKFTPNITIPEIDLLRVDDSGGSLPVGSFYFQIEILDENENVIYTSDVTPQVPIFDESINTQYSLIDGALNVPQFDPISGGVPVTTKSITLRFSNLDLTFKFLRVNVFRKITNNQTISGHSVGLLIPITNTSIEYTYTGFNVSAGDFAIDTSDKLIDNIIYQSSYVMEQVQGRLIRANLLQSKRDYSFYQSFASNITAKWISKEHSSNNQFDLGNSKNPNTYWYKTGFQGDEIYLPGIQYLHTDGEWSPVFPIIGRVKDNIDEQLLTIIGNSFTPLSNQTWLSEVDHIPLNEFVNPLQPKIGNQIERWKVYNTAFITTSQEITHPYEWEGEFGYYETDETYPLIEDCDGNNIWGAGIDENTKVRLIKFPDRRLVSHMSDDGLYLRPFGIKFDNIVYPNSSVIGHRFVYAERTEQDKTVLDSGWSNGDLKTSETNTIISEAPAQNIGNSNFLRYYSANTLFNNQLFSFDYYKHNKAFAFQSPIVANAPADYYDKTLTTDGIVYSIIQPMSAANSVLPKRQNFLENASVFVSLGEARETPFDILFYSTLNASIWSNDAFTPITISKLNYVTEDVSSTLGTQILVTVLDSATNTQLRSHNFYSYKKVNKIPYKSFLTRNYKYIHLNPITTSDLQEFYGGDTLISESTSFRYYKKNPNTFYAPYFHHHFEEHDINTALRVRGTELAFQYFRSTDNDEYNLDKSCTDAVMKPFNEIISEYYKLNTDYNIFKLQKGKSNLSAQYDYCAECQNNFPNRIVFSPKSFDEEVFDLYRLTKTNDYIDLPAHRGEITGLKYQNNQLLVHTRETTFVLQPNPQQIATDQNTAYLTSGDFLSVPPQELVQVDIGAAGCQSKQSQVNTPFGHVWVDQNKGEIFKWDGQLEVLSNKGMLQWFRENLPSELKKEYYRVTGINWPINSTMVQDGVGVICYYDPRFKRLIITKKDYFPLSLQSTIVGITPKNSLYFNGWQGVRTVFDGWDPVESTDPFFFQDKSWTISYNFLDNSFCSFHSYIPPHGWNDSQYFYTFNIYSIYQHQHNNLFQTYYNTKYDMIVEWFYFDVNTCWNSNLYYIGKCYEWDNINKQFISRDKTFDRFVIYNENQSTGLQNLILQNQITNPYQNNKLLNNSKFVIKTDQNYKIAGIYDMSIGQPVMTQDWNVLQTYPKYIDKMVNNTNINFNKSAYNQGLIQDKSAYIRMFYKPAEDYKKILILNILNTKLSKR